MTGLARAGERESYYYYLLKAYSPVNRTGERDRDRNRETEERERHGREREREIIYI